MTPARKEALQWFYDNPETPAAVGCAPTHAMVGRMYQDGQVAMTAIEGWEIGYTLTDKGRRMLHGDPS